MARVVYRLQKARFFDSLLTGEGAKRYGGRWNPVGLPLIYTSATPELAILETLVHLEGSPVAEIPSYQLSELQLPDYLRVFAPDELPDGWNRSPILPGVQTFLVPYLNPLNELAFAVPSVVVPWSQNILINPAHLAIGQVVVLRQQAFTFDERLL